MRAPAFWRGPERRLAAQLLSPVGLIYGAVAAQRLRREGARVSARVICVGNFVAGGAGKTPAALTIARLLRDMGERPAFLSRGYGGARSSATPLRVDAARHSAAEVGDEPLLLAREAPAFICADRAAGARAAAASGASVIVMDDGLQNPALAKDVALALVDGATGLGNGLCLPAGPLRAPMTAQWRHAQAVVIVGAGAPGERVAEEAARRGKPVLRAQIAPEQDACAALRGRRVLAFAGIGRPEKFFDTLDACGAELAGGIGFSDHHAYSARDLSELRARAAQLGAALATTEKDAARLGPDARDMIVLPVRMTFDDEAALRDLISRG